MALQARGNLRRTLLKPVEDSANILGQRTSFLLLARTEMAIHKKEASGVEERSGWAYVWSRSQWKHHFLVLAANSLVIFSSSADKRTKTTKRAIDLKGCCLGILDNLFSQLPTKHNDLLPSRIMKSLTKLEALDINYSQTEAVIITVEHYNQSNKCYFLFFCKKEAEEWKVAIDGVLLASETTKKGSDSPKLSPLRWPFRKKIRIKSETSAFVINDPSLAHGKAGSKRVEPCEKIQVDPLWPDLDTLQGCTDFLRSNCLNVNTLEHMAMMTDHFKSSFQMGDSSLPDELRLEAWKGTARRIVKTMVDELVENNDSLHSCKVQEEHMDQLWLACEMWVFGGIYDKIMGACKQMFATNDSSLDQTLMKLRQVDPLALGVRAEFEEFVLGDALQQFRMLSRYRTPFEKALCLSKTINCILNGIQRSIKPCTGALKDQDGLLPCTDDLLSFLVLMMAQGKVKNLLANACYMENFFNLRKENNGGELAYHMTNFAAACNYLQSETIMQLTENITIPSKPTLLSSPHPPGSTEYSRSNESPRNSYISFTSSNSNNFSFTSSASRSSLSSKHSFEGSSGAYYYMHCGVQECESDATTMFFADTDGFPRFDNHGKKKGNDNREGVFVEEKNWPVRRNIDSTVDWLNNAALLGDERCLERSRFTSGESPDFILASTYQ